MATNLNALVLKVGSDTSGLAAGVKAVRGDITRINNIMRTAAGDTGKLQRATASLKRIYEAGGIEIKEYQRAIGIVTKQYKQNKKEGNEHSATIQKGKSIVAQYRSETDRVRDSITAVRVAHQQGAITSDQHTNATSKLMQKLRELKAEEDGTAAAARRAKQQQTEAMAIVKRSTPEVARLSAQMQLLNRAYKAGQISTQQFRQANAMLREDLRKLSTQSTETTSKMGAMVSQVKGLVAAYLGFNAIRTIGNASMQIEQAAVSFEVFTGSAEEGLRVVNELREYSQNAPTLGETQIFKAAQTMMGFGMESQKVLPIVRQLGDISGGNQERFNSLALAMSQASAAGKLMGQDLLQMINAGFNPLLQISETTGKSIGELKDEMAKGNISFAMVEQAMRDVTSETGRMGGLMDKVGKTFGGQLSSLRKQAVGLGVDFFDTVKPALTTVVSAMASMIKALRQLKSNLNQNHVQIAAVVASFGAAVLIVPKVVAAIGTAVVAVKSITTALVTMQAYSGPAGWATLAAGAGVAAIALGVVDDAFAETIDKQGKMASESVATVKQAKMEMDQINASTAVAASGQLNTAQQMITAYKEQNEELRLQAHIQERGRFHVEYMQAYHAGATVAELNQIKALKQQNDMLSKQAKAREQAAEAQERIAKAKDAMVAERKERAEQLTGAANAKTERETAFERLAEIAQLQRDGLIDSRVTQHAFREVVRDFAQANKQPEKKNENKPIPVITRGSREEYRLITQMQMNRKNDDRKRHEQAQELRREQVKTLREAVAAIQSIEGAESV
jgi:tape measure domain-containing protein